jgi:GntR family transcriptional regulator
MQIEPTSPVPIFRQIAEGIRSSVAAGVYRPGDLLPSIRAQALRLVVNPNTVQRAYEELEREGLIISKKGTGMMVSPDSKMTAKNGVAEQVRSGLAQSISAGQSGGLSRPAVDKLYREAWTEQSGSSSAPEPRKGKSS